MQFPLPYYATLQSVLKLKKYDFCLEAKCCKWEEFMELKATRSFRRFNRRGPLYRLLYFTSLPLLLILLILFYCSLSFKNYLLLTEMSKDGTLIFLGNPSPQPQLITLHFFFPFSLLVLVRLLPRNEIILYYLVFSSHRDALHHSVIPKPKQLLCSWVTAKTLKETLLVSGSWKAEMQTTINIYFQTFQYKTCFLLLRVDCFSLKT